MQANLSWVLGIGSNQQPAIAGNIVTNQDLHLQLDTTIGPSASNQLVNLAFDKDALAMVVILSDKDLTLEFNNSTTGVPTLNLKAGIPLFFYKDMPGITNPFSADVTAAYATNASATDSARLQIFVGFDATP